MSVDLEAKGPLWLETRVPNGPTVHIRVSRAEHYPYLYDLDTYRAILTRDKSWWVSLRFHDRVLAREVIREKYRTQQEAVKRAEALKQMANDGMLPTKGYPLLVWRRWGPTSPYSRPLPQRA